jgi:hypothetical protein
MGKVAPVVSVDFSVEEDSLKLIEIARQQYLRIICRAAVQARYRGRQFTDAPKWGSTRALVT